MIKKVSLARALKEKNRIAGKLRAARDLVNKENSKEKKIPRNIDVRSVLEEARAYESRLIEIKTAIAAANRDIVRKIIELEEVKSEISFFTGIPDKEGDFVITESYSDRVREEKYDAVIKNAEILETVKGLRKRAEALQDELDEFNAVTKVEIEIEE